MEVFDRPAGGPDLAKAKMLEKWLKHYIGLLGLQDWDISVKYASVEGWYSMEIDREWYYRRAELTVDLSSPKITTKTIPAFALHEMFHLVLAPLSSMAERLIPEKHHKLIDDAEENVNWHIENMPLWNMLRGPK